MSEKGQINSPEAYQQIIDYSGLRYKNITPTDIDHHIHFFEIRAEVFVFIEMKYYTAVCKGGQRLAFQRLVDLLPVPAVYVVAEHTSTDKYRPVMGHLCKVREHYSNGKWHNWHTIGIYTLKDVVDAFLRKHGLEKYI